MAGRKVNPALLLPQVPNGFTLTELDRLGRDALETLDQLADTDDYEFDDLREAIDPNY